MLSGQIEGASMLLKVSKINHYNCPVAEGKESEKEMSQQKKNDKIGINTSSFITDSG